MNKVSVDLPTPPLLLNMAMDFMRILLRTDLIRAV